MVGFRLAKVKHKYNSIYIIKNTLINCNFTFKKVISVYTANITTTNTSTNTVHIWHYIV